MSDYGNNITKDHDDFNEKKLVYYHLPVIKSVNQLLEIPQLSETDEKKFFYSRNRKLFLYHKVDIPKRNGDYRTIEVLDYRVKEIQQIINKVKLSKFHMSNNCHGFVKNKSILTNALPHIGTRVLMKFDFENFFPSIKLHNVISQFRFFGYGKNVSRYLGYLCVNSNFSLPQGAPTSPYLFNLMCLKIDKRISKYCEKRN